MSGRATNAHDEASSSASLLDAALSLARTQLVGQLADETSVDGRLMGTLGFSGALLAACLAARSLLGAFWWMPLLVSGTSEGELVAQIVHEDYSFEFLGLAGHTQENRLERSLVSEIERFMIERERAHFVSL